MEISISQKENFTKEEQSSPDFPRNDVTHNQAFKESVITHSSDFTFKNLIEYGAFSFTGSQFASSLDSQTKGIVKNINNYERDLSSAKNIIEIALKMKDHENDPRATFMIIRKKNLILVHIYVLERRIKRRRCPFFPNFT